MCRFILSFFLLQAGLFAEELVPEIPLMVECPCPILLDTLQLDLGLVKLPTPDPFDEQAIR